MAKILIEDLTSSGEGVGTLEGKKVFVDGALPTEEVGVEITSSKKRFSKAKLLKILSPSKDRVDPICPLFGTCGGCQIMHLDYPAQLKWKRARVQNALQRIGGIEVDVAPCTPSPDPLGYRNKIHLHNGGFYKRHSHEVVPVDKCYIHNPIGEKALPLAMDAKEAIIKTSLNTEEVLLVLDGKGDRPFITEKLGDLHFKIRSQDFFQINPKQALQLYEKAILCAEIDTTMRVLDAYSGVGTLSLFAAKKAKEVVGIEIVRSAVKSAQENALLNNIFNTSFRFGKVENELPKLGTFDVIFLNPPRGGVDEKVLQALIKHPPKRLLYISCDPATLSRDLKILQKKFAIKGVFPFDMFPQTAHVETLVSLTSN
ncbi:MAG: 23S rRNA (uracil(1939)-C(5))-methyltransferase RlmD [Simkaniaceae bacterium]|nr:23S rRNA (uracil(1939)-C(5))-methyltransferase RlmD [Candidatus Sacchlamyda saccharinae]